MALVIGMAITRLLTGLVSIFRARLRAELDWVPVAWALVMLLTLLETWVSLNALPTLSSAVSFGEYLGLGGMVMLLYAAAAVVNVRLLGGQMMALWFALDFTMVALPVLAFLSRSRRVEEAVTALYLPPFAIDLHVSLTS